MALSTLQYGRLHNYWIKRVPNRMKPHILAQKRSIEDALPCTNRIV